MGASATIAGQNLGAGDPDRAAAGVRVASDRPGRRAGHRRDFWLIPGYLLAIFGMSDPQGCRLATNLIASSVCRACS